MLPHCNPWSVTKQPRWALNETAALRMPCITAHSKGGNLCWENPEFTCSRGGDPTDHISCLSVWERARKNLNGVLKCVVCVCDRVPGLNYCQICCSGNEHWRESHMQTAAVRADQSKCLVWDEVCLLYCVTLLADPVYTTIWWGS